MQETNILTFEQAIDTSGAGRRHILLGNGFSISWKDSVFRYDSLLNQAAFDSISVPAIEIFEALDTTDFEYVMRSLNDSSKIIPIYQPNSSEISANMVTDSSKLRDVLVKTIADNHPERPSEITEDEYENAINFLSRFDGNIYTLNYDLLLYWVMMKAYSQNKFKCTDGFIDPEEESTYVVWDTSGSNHPRVYYLHGALHLFDSGIELQKFTWVRTQKRLIEQITEALSRNLYPHFVSEGTSEQKLKHIRHSDYLSRGFQSFSGIGRIKEGQDSLFIFGHSLADNDDHILSVIPKSNIVMLFISVYGSTTTDAFQKKQRKAELLKQKRAEIIKDMKSNGSKNLKKPLEIYFYDALSVKVWR